MKIFANFDEKLKHYIATFDLGDYNSILPNSDTYYIVIIFDNSSENY